jgi:hypothetical protein
MKMTNLDKTIVMPVSQKDLLLDACKSWSDQEIESLPYDGTPSATDLPRIDISRLNIIEWM